RITIRLMIIHEMAIYAISAAIDRRLRAFLIADSATNRNAIAADWPQIMVIGCCDSRVSPEVIFDACRGELFVVRNVANVTATLRPMGALTVFRLRSNTESEHSGLNTSSCSATHSGAGSRLLMRTLSCFAGATSFTTG